MSVLFIQYQPTLIKYCDMLSLTQGFYYLKICSNFPQAVSDPRLFWWTSPGPETCPASVQNQGAGCEGICVSSWWYSGRRWAHSIPRTSEVSFCTSDEYSLGSCCWMLLGWKGRKLTLLENILHWINAFLLQTMNRYYSG